MTSRESRPVAPVPRRRSTAARPSDETLLDGVLPVFATRSFETVTMHELASAAGASKPTLYAHFGTKEQLFDACARREAGNLLEWMRDSYQRAQGLDLDQHIATTTRALFDFAATHPDGFSVLFGASTAERSHEMRSAAIQSVADTVAGLIRNEYGGSDLQWAASADFCAAVITDIGVRGILQAHAQHLDFTAAADLTISIIVAAMRHLDPAAVRSVDAAGDPKTESGDPSRTTGPAALGPISELTDLGPHLPVSRGDRGNDVIDAAIRIFLRGERLELHAVATELGISRTTIYRRFGTREDLLGVVLACQFERLITGIDRRCDSRGAQRISEVLDRALRRLATDPALRTYLQNESPAALRLITQADGPVHRGSVKLAERLIQRAQEQDGYRPPVERSTLAFALVRLGEGFLYSNAVNDIQGDIDHLLQVQTSLLGGESVADVR